jgi:hypothetical protein
MTSRSSLLDVSLLERAVYVDFEGNANRPPTFVGALCGGEFEQVVLEDTFSCVCGSYAPRPHSAPDGYQARLPHCGRAVLRTQTLELFTRELVARCQQEGRRIVAWSRYEKDLLVAAVPDLTAAIAALYVDAKQQAKPWKTCFHRNVRFMRTRRGGRHKLKSYLPLIGYHLESYFGHEQAGPRIEFVRRQLLKTGDYASITRTAKGKWTKVLDYNWHDCYGLRELAVTVTKDLANVSEERRHAA